MGIKSDYRAFFAIPFDSATMSLYEQVAQRLRKKYPNLTIIIGNKAIGPSPKYNDILSFKAQNTELFLQFISEIQKADVLLVDLTHNNPNVHVELGIALTLNKNILRVTGRALTELGFDIRNYEVHQYKNRNDLYNKITEYIDLFFMIKNLNFFDKHPAIYASYPDEKQLNGMKEKSFDLHTLRNFRLRDGKVRAQFKFIGQKTGNDWFGIFLRFYNNPLISSYLVYVRKNGMVEIAEYPGPEILCKGHLVSQGITSEEFILVEIDNNMIKATVKDKYISYDKLQYQFRGQIGLGCWQSEVSFRNVEVLCQDTIDSYRI